MAESLESTNSSESESTPTYSFATPPTLSQEAPDLTSKLSSVKRLINLKEECKSPALRVPASPLMKRLGYGTGVGVYLMERSPKASGEIRSPWAIKKIMKTKESKSIYAERLEYEASILKKLHHINIVGYRGFSKLNNSKAFLAMEKAPTSLCDMIEDRMTAFLNSKLDQSLPTPFPAKSIEKVGLDISNALDYLHEEKKIIHGDLKSANVLIFGDFDLAKLCDFGVARKLKNDGTIEGYYVGTEIWNPMEVILQHRDKAKYPITSKVDIYPFGLTIYEMISLKPPHLPTEDDDSFSGSDASFDESSYDDMLAQFLGTRPLLPDLEFNESYNKVLEIFYCCTEEDPSSRPTAADIFTLLHLVDPLKSQIFPN